jgi:hypothetical protein
MERKSSIVSAIILGVALVVCAVVLGRSVQRFKADDRFISVKGFSEREVKADFAIWSLKVRTANNDLLEGSRELEVAKTKVYRFLTKNGINPKEISQKDLSVSDREAREYRTENVSTRYIFEETVEVRSTNVDLVQKVSRMTGELLSAGVALSVKEDFNALRFIYTKLNEVKPVMLAEATRNARKAGEEFARESDTRLGEMRKATQGLFSIVDRDASLSGQAEGGYYSGSADIFKKIRVVISVDYSIN